MKIKHSLLSFMLTFLLFTSIYGENSFKTRYAVVTYEDEDFLEDFNDKLKIPRKLYILVKKRKSVTLEDEVKNKIDVIIEKVEAVLEMFPKKVKFQLYLVEDEAAVKKVSKSKRLAKKPLIGFFNPKTFDIYLSVEDVNLKVFAHEVGHMIVESFFEVTPPVITHELMAQFAAARASR
jgi:hypothetical protein